MHLTYRDSGGHSSPVSTANAEEAGAPDIEVTPAMIEAGLAELYGFDRETCIAEEAVVAIFRKMMAASL